MPSHTLYVVEAFEEREGGVVPAESKACHSEASPVSWRVGLR